MIGVLGGMGPVATVDFMAKLVRLVPAERDQEHLPVVVVSDPRIPDRVGPILRGEGESPLPAMLTGVRRLERAGAQVIAMPCHTAHVWYDRIAAATELPVLHIAQAVGAELARCAVPEGPLGLLATAATLKAGLYQVRLERLGYACVVPPEDVMERTVLPAIALIKRARAPEAAALLDAALSWLRGHGAGTVLLACTELPVAQAAAPERLTGCIDATAALARACIAWWLARKTLSRVDPAAVR